MPEVLPNFSEVNEFENLADGTYPVRVFGVEGRKTKDGTPYLNWTLKVFDSPEPRANGRIIFHNTPISGQYAYILRNFLKAANPEYPGGKFDTDDFIGRALEVTIKNKPDPKTGAPSKYPSVTKQAPYVPSGSVPTSGISPGGGGPEEWSSTADDLPF